ncbi:CRBL2-like protein [Mya arenaria]|uniref:CRBL2-like protein n=1 Tax=Mya arenaria TaxID=6604 RepID=A0ABY7F6J1_MYAAR|nr:cAMP-responsive element-binding protein-like 2 [Mya arenaria]WAR17812.1 CRBL2-like protein [Mya arenaria]
MNNTEDLDSKLQIIESPQHQEEQTEQPGPSEMSGDRPARRAGRRPGRKTAKMDVRAKLERSRQSARECRARKKLRYQYLEDLVANREKAVFALREEMEMWKNLCTEIDEGRSAENLKEKLLKTCDNQQVKTNE